MKTVNDIDLKKWKEYPEILTDSLWVIDKRDSSGVHNSNYHGNFIPQIPHQMMLRYTKKGDWVLDPFCGSGTTLIEAKRLGRNCMGVELNRRVATHALHLLASVSNDHAVKIHNMDGDSATFNFENFIRLNGIEDLFSLVILHPPYHDIIKFSDDPRCLSRACDIDDFLAKFGKIVKNIDPSVKKGGHLVLVIGDKYEKGEWIPLGFHCMCEVYLANQDYILKSIVVKNFEETKGKRNQKSLWRYRALAGGFYVFKHEYIMIFKKEGVT